MGYHGCGEAIRDKELFVAGARKGFDALMKAARPKKAKTTAKPAAKKAAPARKSGSKSAAGKKIAAHPKRPTSSQARKKPRSK
jgi:hypothetical protein